MGKIRKIALLFTAIFVAQFLACNNSPKSDLKNAETQADTLKKEIQEAMPDTTSLEDELDYLDFPKLSIIIDDFGNYNNFMKDSLLVKYGDLPSEVAFAILPNLPYSQFVMEFFQFTDRELLLHAPLEPQNSKINAGEVVIKADDDAITIINKLNNFYSELPNIQGLNNHMGSKATENIDVMTTIIEWCKSNELFFIDSATSSKSIGFDIAMSSGINAAKRDIFLDVPDPSRKTVDSYLAKMQKYYKANRNILVITHAHSLERRDNLQYFIDECVKMGYKLTPVSEYCQRTRFNYEDKLQLSVSLAEF